MLWYGRKGLLIALMLIDQSSSQWGKKTRSCWAKLFLLLIIDKEIEELHKTGLTIEDKAKRYEWDIQYLRSMNDGKMQKVLVGREGEFCILCLFSDQDAIFSGAD